MISKISPALMITEEDIKQLLNDWRNVPAWIKAHVLPKNPAHRYEGELAIDKEMLVFSGRDIREGRDFKLEMALANIISIELQFSDQLNACIDAAFDIGGPVPLAAHYQDNARSERLFFNTGFIGCTACAEASNRRWYETLNGLVNKY